MTEYTQVFAEQLQDSLDQVTRGVINAGTNVAYAGTATVRSGLASGVNLSWAELRNARRILKNSDVLPLEDGKYAARCIYVFPADGLDPRGRVTLVVRDAEEREVAKFTVDLAAMR